MEKKQLSVAFSDFILAVVTFYTSQLIFSKSLSASLGMISIATAAVAGTLRFSGVKQVRTIHDLLTGIGSTVGLLLIAVSYFFRLSDMSLSLTIFSATIAFYLTYPKPKIYERYSLLCGGVCIAATVLKGVQTNNQNLFIAAALLVISGMVGVNGTIQGIKRVNIFHYVLAGAMFFIGRSFLHV